MGNRRQHQPATGPVRRKNPKTAELQQICRRAAVLLVATDQGTAPVVADPLRGGQHCPLAKTLQAALAAYPASVQVLANKKQLVSERFEAVMKSAALRAGTGRAGTLPYNPSAKLTNEQDVSSKTAVELFGVSEPVLAAAQACLEAEPKTDAVIIMAADQPAIKPRHLYELCKRFSEHPEADAVTSWIMWLRRLPLLVSRETLLQPERLPGWMDENGAVAVPQLTVEEVVFGEEPLAAPNFTPAAIKEFFGTCTMSALEAVRLAKCSEREEGRCAANNAAHGNATKPEPLPSSPADRELLEAAQLVLRRLKQATSPESAKAIAEADAWGQRNKLDFPIFATEEHKKSLVYLDSAATSQRLGAALAAQYNFDANENANVYRGAYELSAKATATLNDARASIERFINADRRQTVLTANASAANNLVAQAWGLRNIRKGDLIAVGLAEHHSNFVPWQILAEEKGARLAFIPLDNSGRIDRQAYRSILTQKPKLVCLAHISNVLGIENPAAELAAEAHAAGARFLLDAAQSFPHVKIDVKELGCDFLSFSGHKCYGPMGIGGLWISPEAFAEMVPLQGGGGTISHVSTDSYYLRPGAIQYEVGTPAVSQAVGLAAACDYLDRLGMDAVQRHSAALTEYLMNGLEQQSGVTIWGDHRSADGQTGLVAFSVAGSAPAQAGSVMGKLGVAVRSGGHCALPLSASMGAVGTTRISFGIHNTAEDVEAALTALVICCRLFQDKR